MRLNTDSSQSFVCFAFRFLFFETLPVYGQQINKEQMEQKHMSHICIIVHLTNCIIQLKNVIFNLCILYSSSSSPKVGAEGGCRGVPRRKTNPNKNYSNTSILTQSMRLLLILTLAALANTRGCMMQCNHIYDNGKCTLFNLLKSTRVIPSKYSKM